MCGITGFYVKTPGIVDSENDVLQFDRFLDKLLLGIEHRGRDSTGFVAASGTIIQMDKKAVQASDFIKTRRRAWMDKSGTRMVLGHTRLATQGAPEKNQNNHPVLYKDTFITHNGHIHNDDDVFDDIDLPRGDTAVDSVAIAATLSKHGWDNLPAALKLLRGSYAVAAVNPTKHPDELLLIKGPASPLHYYESKHLFIWASTNSAIRDALETIGLKIAWNDVKSLDEGDVIHVKDGEVALKEKFFEPTKPSYSSTGFGRGSSGSSTGNWSSTGGRKLRTILNLIEPIKAKRDAGNGVAIVWETRDRMTQEQLRRHNGRFTTCMHCRGLVAEFHIMDNATWGDICVDCLAFALNSATRLPTRAPSTPATPTKDPAAWAGMSDDDYEFLNEYAEFEYELMLESVELVGQRTGLSKEMIFYMVFCADDANLNEATDSFREKLMEEYLSAEKYLATSTLPSNTPEDEGESCEVDCIIPPPKEEPKLLEPPRQTRGGELGRCDHCNKKAKLYMNGKRWCNRHADKCSRRGCKAAVVAFGPDGKMLCHMDSRGVKQLTMVPRVATTA